MVKLIDAAKEPVVKRGQAKKGNDKLGSKRQVVWLNILAAIVYTNHNSTGG